MRHVQGERRSVELLDEGLGPWIGQSLLGRVSPRLRWEDVKEGAGVQCECGKGEMPVLGQDWLQEAEERRVEVKQSIGEEEEEPRFGEGRPRFEVAPRPESEKLRLLEEELAYGEEEPNSDEEGRCSVSSSNRQTRGFVPQPSPFPLQPFEQQDVLEQDRQRDPPESPHSVIPIFFSFSLSLKSDDPSRSHLSNPFFTRSELLLQPLDDRLQLSSHRNDGISPRDRVPRRSRQIRHCKHFDLAQPPTSGSWERMNRREVFQVRTERGPEFEGSLATFVRVEIERAEGSVEECGDSSVYNRSKSRESGRDEVPEFVACTRRGPPIDLFGDFDLVEIDIAEELA